MVERIVQHVHCRMCGRATPPDDEFCGDECREEHAKMMRKKKNQYIILFAFALGMMLLSMILFWRGVG